MGIKLDGNVVIIDEAHNLIENINQVIFFANMQNVFLLFRTHFFLGRKSQNKDRQTNIHTQHTHTHTSLTVAVFNWGHWKQHEISWNAIKTHILID